MSRSFFRNSLVVVLPSGLFISAAIGARAADALATVNAYVAACFRLNGDQVVYQGDYYGALGFCRQLGPN